MEGKTEFAVFCIENIARKMEVDARQVYKALAKDSSILTSYIIPNYEMLHTQGREYIVNDIIDVMKAEGVVVC